MLSNENIVPKKQRKKLLKQVIKSHVDDIVLKFRSVHIGDNTKSTAFSTARAMKNL